MRALHLGLLLLLAPASGCMNAACIQYGTQADQDRCVDDLVSFLCDDDLEDESAEDGWLMCTNEDDLPIRCDEYRLGTSCEGQGFGYTCGDIWYRVAQACS